MADSTFIWRTRTGAPRRIVWASSTHGYVFYSHFSAGAETKLVYQKTVDGGVTWSTAEHLNSSNGRYQFFGLWADWWTPGYECSPYIHIAALNAGGPSAEYQRFDISNDCQLWPFGRNLGLGITGGIGSATAPSNIDLIRTRAGNLHVAFWNIHVLGHTLHHVVSTGIEATTQAWRGLDSTSIFSPIQGSQVRANRFIFQPGDQNTSQDFFVFDWNSTEAAIRRGYFDFDSTLGTSSRLGLLSEWVKVSCNIAPALGNVNQSWDVVNRHHDGKSLVTVRKGFDSADATFEFWEVGSTSIVKKTDPATGDDQIDCALTIVNNSYHHDTQNFPDTTNPHIYFFTLGTSTEVVVSNVRPRRYVSTDGGSNWSTQGGVIIGDDSGRNFQTIHASYSIGGRSGRGGQVASFWGENDPADYTYRTNSTHYIGIANTTGDCTFFPVPTTTGIGVGPGTVVPSIIVDFDNDNNFETTEDIVTDVKKIRWNRGGEPEQTNTPGGSFTVELADPNGDYIPGSSTRWGAGNVLPGRQIRATLSYGGTAYTIFRGRVQSFTPKAEPEEKSAVIFAVDNRDDFNRAKVSHMIGPETTSLASSTGDRPLQGITIGGATGALSRLANEVGFSSNRWQISQPGETTLDNFWFYKENGDGVLDLLETHERKGRIFFNSSGSLTFHSSTHREGSVSQYTFNANFSNLQFVKSSRNLRNQSFVTSHDRQAGVAAVLGFTNSTSLPTIASGSTFITTIEFNTKPVWNVVVPAPEVNSTRGISVVGASNTSYDSSSIAVSGQVIGASALRIKIANNSGETVSIRRPENATDTNSTIPVTGTPMTDKTITSTAQVNGTFARYGVREISQDLRYISGFSKASQRATDLLANNSTSHLSGIKLSVFGSDSDLITQILSREIDDRISLTSTDFHLSAKPFYITAIEGELGSEGVLSATFTLEEAT